MIIVGAGGFAKEVFSCLINPDPASLCFYDDVNPERISVFTDYKILKNEDQVKAHFLKYDKSFTIGIGNSDLRQRLYNKFITLGGEFTSVISERAFLAKNGVHLDVGVNLLPGVNISSGVNVGKGTMVYYNSSITHNCQIGDFVEIAPGVQILGRVTIGDGVFIGAGAVILPDLKIGKHAVIGAGAVVTKDVGVNKTVIGIPAKELNS